ncbi:MAG TPA: Gfo/Idh/MocA family oxidoreductase [Abditibacteriaceae bacterium]
MTNNRISRRRFVTGATVASASVAASPFAGITWMRTANAQNAPSNKITMGCIGTGGMGQGNMDNFLGQSDVRVLAVCDVDKNHLRDAKNKVDGRYGNTDCAAYTDFRELLARTDIDAISLATPDHWHAIPAIMAAKAGMDIYGEKPISHTLAEGIAMVDAVQKYGRIWQTGSWQRSQRDFRFACELVRNGRIGKVVKIEVGLPTGSGSGPVNFSEPPPHLDYDFWVGPSPWTPYSDKRAHWNWRWQLNYGGGQMMDWIGHHGDIAHWGMGWDDTGPVEVEGSAKFPDSGIWDAPTEYYYIAKYKNGTEMHVANGGNKGIRGGTKWIGEDGRWVWVDRGGLDANPKSLLQEKIGPEEIQLYRTPGHHRNFLDCVKSRQTTITPASAAHRSASIGHLGQIAMLLGRKIRWNPDTQEIIGDAAASRMLGKPQRAPWHL